MYKLAQLKEAEVRGVVAALVDNGVLQVNSPEQFEKVASEAAALIDGYEYNINDVAEAAQYSLQKTASSEVVTSALGELALQKLAGEIDDATFEQYANAIVKEAANDLVPVDTAKGFTYERVRNPSMKSRVAAKASKAASKVGKNLGKIGLGAGLIGAGAAGKTLYDHIKGQKKTASALMGAIRANDLSDADKHILAKAYGLDDDANFRLRNAGRGELGGILGGLGGSLGGAAIGGLIGGGRGAALLAPLTGTAAGIYGALKATDKYSHKGVEEAKKLLAERRK